uniref:CAAX prenyl protease 1 N-terminal domain-containing protein n=1 Tax=Lygus hesperus TaxID=30085 RepID=A0A0A9Y4I0_LYGHE
MSWSLTYRTASEESDVLIILIALHWAADAWKIFLFSRQLSLASNTLDVPPVLRKRMSAQDYDVARRKSIQSSIATISSVAILLLVKTFKLYVGYHFFIWEFTADQAKTKYWRAVLYAGYDELFSMLIALPFSFFEALMYSQMPVVAMIIVSFLEIFLTTIFSAATIASLMMIIESCGPGLLLYFAPLSNAIALFVIAVYIQYFVPQIYFPWKMRDLSAILSKGSQPPWGTRFTKYSLILTLAPHLTRISWEYWEPR